MTTFLFWNINKQPLEPLVAQLAHERAVDVVLLAECEDPRAVLQALNKEIEHPYRHQQNPIKSKVEFFSRSPYGNIQSLGDYRGLTFRRLLPPESAEIMLVGTHLPSKLRMSEQEQMLQCAPLVRQIAEYEARLGHSRTLVIGDLNMNPFEPGIVAAGGFHAVSSRQVAQRMARQVQGERYKFFYNPMWSHFGEQPTGPPGTYYYDNSASVNIFWNIFDQVLIRPELLPNFRDETVSVVAHIGGKSLLSRSGQPNKRLGSDHLPLLFALDLTEDL